MLGNELNGMHQIKQKKWLPWFICSLGALYYCYEYLLRISPSVMIDDLMNVYHLTGAEVGSLSAFYYHAYVPMQIIVGLLMDRYGPRRLLTIACLCCAFGSYLFATTHFVSIAQLGRFLVGLGSAFAFVGALKIATIWLPPNRFAFISGLITCLGMVGAMIGDIVLRGVVDTAGWQLATYSSAAVGVFLTLAIWLFMRDVNPYSTNRRAQKTKFNELLLGLWGALKNPQIWLNGAIGFLLYLSLSAFAELWGIPYLEQAHGLSNMQAAHVNSMVFLGWAIGGPFWGWLSDFIQRRRVPLLLSAIGSFTLACFILYFPHLSIPVLYIALLLFGILSSAQILVFAICHELTSIKVAGTAIALTNMIVMLGGNLFQPLIGKFLDIAWSGEMLKGIRIYSAHAYQLALGIIPASIFLVLIILFFLRETHGKAANHNTHTPSETS
jgi:sugar phosphate permease